MSTIIIKLGEDSQPLKHLYLEEIFDVIHNALNILNLKVKARFYMAYSVLSCMIKKTCIKYKPLYLHNALILYLYISLFLPFKLYL